MIDILCDLVICLLAADLISGIVHWAEDTWAAPGTYKFLDKWVVLPNIEHHRNPGKLRETSYWETNLVSIVIATAIACVMMIFRVHAWQAYLTIAMASQLNQVHAWAHTRKSPLLVRWLQRVGILQSIRHHGEHHKRPYASRFCTTTNFLNPIIDSIGFWHGLEWLIQRFGIPMRRATPARDGY